MSPNTKDAITYTASVNPPRRAKRARIEAEQAPAVMYNTNTQQSSQPRRPQLLPKEDPIRRLDDSPDQDSSDDEDDYCPGEPVATAPKRRGRKPGPLSRSARESQRKLNHSRIEKARRTKINETLATLSNLVNEAERQRVLDGIKPAEPAAEPESKKESKGEKEFKLDVLVKTVTYIQELIQKVQTLELKTRSSACDRCSSASSPTSLGVKRKRSDDGTVDVRVTEVTDNRSSPAGSISIMPSPRPTTFRVPTSSPDFLPISAQSPCLPPISSWLPHPYLDPSAISSFPSPDSTSAANPSSHLPTPPLSGNVRTPLAHTTSALPALSLPGPAHPSLSHSFATSTLSPPSPSTFSSNTGASQSSSTEFAGTSNPASSSKAMHITLPTRRLSRAASNVSLSPTVSPSWTPEDENAASLLLQMSSSPSGSNTGLATPRAHRKSFGAGAGMEGVGREHRRCFNDTVLLTSDSPSERRGAMQAETPSSLLGIRTSMSG